MDIINSPKNRNGEVCLRPVSISDLKKIYVWRNHPDIRKYSLNDKEISWEEHVKFWDNFIRLKKGYGFIIVYNGADCGVIRLDIIDKNTAEISIFISPNFQNLGIGTKSLTLICELSKKYGIDTLIAKIKYNNNVSERIFTKNNFKPKYIVYEKKLK